MRPAVYEIRHKASGKVYVGSSADAGGRWSGHLYDLRRNSHHSPHLQYAWNKYGESAFTFKVIENCDLVKLLDREQFWINQKKAYDRRYGYNVCTVAGSRVGVPSPEVAESNRRRTYDSGKQRAKVLGLKRSDQTKAKISHSKQQWWNDPKRKQQAAERTRLQWETRKMKQTGERKLTTVEFGRQLLDANDLDPAYPLVYHAGFDHRDMRRFLLAYFCFYHVGTVSWICDAPKKRHEDDNEQYWKRMAIAAASKDYPRSPERRHFRADNAIDSVAWLKSLDMVNLFAPFDEARTSGQWLSATAVRKWVQDWHGFGPWISFKAADMLERVGYCRVQFTAAEALYDSPLEGAKLMWQMMRPNRPMPPNVGEWAMEKLIGEFGDVKAPPLDNRNFSYPEAETVLCKYHSYYKGHYKIGEDVTGCRKAIEWAKHRGGKTWALLEQAGRTAKLWA